MPTPLISIAVCTHNEGVYVRRLLERLGQYISSAPKNTFEMVVIDDYSSDPITKECLTAYDMLDRGGFGGDATFRLLHHKLNFNYAEHKNFMNQQCRGAWILNLDADEYFEDSFLDILPDVVESNPFIDAYWIPRLNVVDGLTPEHIAKWGWRVSTVPGFDKPVVNWPDMQMRFYRNVPKIKWENRVHERLTGFDQFSAFPLEVEFAIRHFKEIWRQEQQNLFYETLQTL